MDILNDGSVCNNLKQPYLRFLLWVYLNTASGMVDSGAGDLPHSGYVLFIITIGSVIPQIDLSVPTGGMIMPYTFV